MLENSLDEIEQYSSDRSTELMQKRGQLKGTNIFMNGHMSPKNSELFREARRLKREKKVFGARTMQSTEQGFRE